MAVHFQDQRSPSPLANHPSSGSDSVRALDGAVMRPRRLLLHVIVVVAGWTMVLPAWHRSAAASEQVPVAALWEDPVNLRDRDLFNGPWGAALAPDPDATYRFVRFKEHGANPGVIVRDRLGRTWHVKQPHEGHGDEGPVEVVLSRVLSAVGYHQPPLYLLRSFTMAADGGTRRTPGGRFRLDEPSMQHRGEWSWDNNPFAGTRPYQGLLVMLLMFNSWDLKDSNNSLYDVRRGDHLEQWYVVRDLGGALGESGHRAPKRNDIDTFERSRFRCGSEGECVQDWGGGE